MIEIKNKRMLLFPEDRIIGVEGDVNTAERKFVLDRVQDGFDLSSFVAWIKLEPANGEQPYSQLVKKEIVGDRIVLTWLLSGANLKAEGELSAQVVLASPDYFKEEDLQSLSADDLIVPSVISGVSAPIWQSHKETFIVDSSIDDTIAYQEVTKNVLVAALAQMVENVEKTQELYEECESTKTAVGMMYGSVSENIEYAEILRSATEDAALRAQDSKEEIELLKKSATESAAAAAESERISSNNAEITNANAYECVSVLNQTADLYKEAQQTLRQERLEENYRLIFSKTLTADDTGCVSFEIDKGQNGKPLNLKEFCFFIYIPIMPTAQSGYLRLDVKSDNESGFSRISQFAGISSSADSYLRIEAKNKGRWTSKYSKGTTWFQNAESVSVGGTLCATSRASDGKPATAVRLSQYSGVGVDFPAGTMVEMWGINSPTQEEGANE